MRERERAREREHEKESKSERATERQRKYVCVCVCVCVCERERERERADRGALRVGDASANKNDNFEHNVVLRGARRKMIVQKVNHVIVDQNLRKRNGVGAHRHVAQNTLACILKSQLYGHFRS